MEKPSLAKELVKHFKRTKNCGKFIKITTRTKIKYTSFIVKILTHIYNNYKSLQLHI